MSLLVCGKKQRFSALLFICERIGLDLE